MCAPDNNNKTNNDETIENEFTDVELEPMPVPTSNVRAPAPAPTATTPVVIPTTTESNNVNNNKNRNNNDDAKKCCLIFGGSIASIVCMLCFFCFILPLIVGLIVYFAVIQPEMNDFDNNNNSDIDHFLSLKQAKMDTWINNDDNNDFWNN